MHHFEATILRLYGQPIEGFSVLLTTVICGIAEKVLLTTDPPCFYANIVYVCGKPLSVTR